MNDNLSYEKIKSIKFPKSYENEDKYNKTKDFTNSDLLREKLAKLENNIKYSNPNKNNLIFKSSLQNKNNFVSNFANSNKVNEKFNENESLNNSIKLMDIKLNHEILQNKIENMRKDLLKETNDSNYNTISTSNYFGNSKTLNAQHILQNNSKTPKSYNDRINIDSNFRYKEKENNVNFNNLNKDYEENMLQNKYSTLNNFYTQKDFSETFNNNKTSVALRDDSQRDNFHFDQLNKNMDDIFLNKKIGNISYVRESILPKFDIKNNEMKFDYTKRDLADLEGKIQTTKKKLNDCIHKAETMIIDKRHNNNVISKDILNEHENTKQYTNNKTIDARRSYDFKKDQYETISDYDDSGYYDQQSQQNNKKIKGSDNINKNEDYQKNLVDLTKKFQPSLYLKKNYSSEKSDDYTNVENYNGKNEFNMKAKRYENQINTYKNYNTFKNPEENFINDNFGQISYRSKNQEKNFHKNDASKSNISNSKKGYTIKNLNNQDDNLYTIHTNSTNNNNNTINIMDSLRVSDNSEEVDNNTFLNNKNDDLSHLDLNMSGIAADLIGIKNQNIDTKYYEANNRLYKINKNLSTNKHAYNKNVKENDENIDIIKGIKNYEFTHSNYDTNFPKTTRNKDTKYFFDKGDTRNLGDKKPFSNTNNNFHQFKQKENNFENFTPRSNNYRNSINNEKLKHISNSISPIKNNEKVKFTEKEIDGMVSKYLEQSTPKDYSNNLNYYENSAKNFSTKKLLDKTKLKELILNEVNKDENLEIEVEYNNENNSQKPYISKLHSHKQEKYNDTINAYQKQKTGIKPINNEELSYVKSEKDKKVQEILCKIPEIINEFNKKKGKIKAENQAINNVNAHFFNLNNLGKWIDLSKSKIGKQDEKTNNDNNNNNDSHLTAKDILNEADNIINNHVLKMKKITNDKDTHINLDLSKDKIFKLIKDDSPKHFINENKKEQNLLTFNTKESHEESKVTLDKKINFIYDILKNFSHSKLKDLISNQAIKQVSKENHQNNLNVSKNLKENIQRCSNKDINQKLEMSIRKDNDLAFSDNKKISFEKPKMPIKLKQEKQSHFYHESKDNNDNNLSPNLVLSPDANTYIEKNIINSSNLNYLDSNLINVELSDINKYECESNFITSKKIIEPYDIIEKRIEKIIEDNILTDKFGVTASPEKRDISPTKLKKKTTLKSNQVNEEIILNTIDNGIKESPSPIKNERTDQEQENQEKKQIDSLTKKIDFCNEDNNEESVDYEISQGNNYNEDAYDEEEDNNYNENKNEETEEKNIYSEEEPRSLDDCINKLNSSNKKEEKQHVKFEKFLHSNSAKVITSRNLKNKNADNLRTEFENGIDEYQRQNHSDAEIETEKIDEEIKLELNKNVVSDIPYTNKDKQSKVKFSEKLVFIEYEDESFAENIKVYNQAGKPDKHIKFNLLKYLIRIKNNKYKSKKILHYYYNGIRDDKLPKKLLSSLKRTNSFSEQDKELGLKKLNEFLNECNKENQLSDVKEQQKKRIVERNINTIHEIEEARKKGVKIKKARSPTPKKIVQSHLCKKFKGDPNKFFSKNPPNSLLKVFNIHTDNSAMKSVKSIGKFSERLTNKSNFERKLTGLTTTDLNNNDLNNKIINEKNNLNEFNLNSNPSKKNQKEKELKNIISNINLEESMNSLERDSNILKESALLNEITSLNSFVQSPEKNIIIE